MSQIGEFVEARWVSLAVDYICLLCKRPQQEHLRAIDGAKLGRRKSADHGPGRDAGRAAELPHHYHVIVSCAGLQPTERRRVSGRHI